MTRSLHGVLVSNLMPSTQGHHKYYVILEFKDGTKKTVHFGHKDYDDYTQHKDPERRRRYLLRASAIKDKNGDLTKDDIRSPNFWSINVLWGPTTNAKTNFNRLFNRK